MNDKKVGKTALDIKPAVDLLSKGFYETGLTFPIDWNSIIAIIEINRKMICEI